MLGKILDMFIVRHWFAELFVCGSFDPIMMFTNMKR